jgi:hypothetical protein
MNASEDSAFQAYKKIQEDEEQREHTLLLESELGRHNHYKNETLILDTVLKYDQGIRKELALRVRAFGRMSKEVNEVYPIMRYVDSVNCLKVTKILDEHGWLGATEIGSEGNSTLFLVIQHAELDVQEKYLPMLRKSVEDGNAEASALAYLEDRVLLKHGKKQLYGSQIEYDTLTDKYIVSPIEDEPNVNKRRASVGLGPLEDYVKIWGIEYVLPKD